MTCPLGVHQYCCGSYCHVPSRFTGVPPDAGTMYSRVDAVAVGLDVNVIDRPSGDHARSPSVPFWLVRWRGVPPPIATTKTSPSLREASSRFASYGSTAMESATACTTESGRIWGSATYAIH